MAGEATRAACRAAALVGRRAAVAVGQRDTVVTLEVTTYDAAINVAGAAVSATSVTTLEPAPKVTRLGAGDPSYFGGSLASDAGGDLTADLFRVGPLTKPCAGGGYDPATLLVDASASKSVRVRLVGDDHAAAGTLCRVLRIEGETPQSFTLIVQRTTQT
jgi:hypothetical protein